MAKPEQPGQLALEKREQPERPELLVLLGQLARPEPMALRAQPASVRPALRGLLEMTGQPAQPVLVRAVLQEQAGHPVSMVTMVRRVPPGL